MFSYLLCMVTQTMIPRQDGRTEAESRLSQLIFPAMKNYLGYSKTCLCLGKYLIRFTSKYQII